MLTTSPFRSAVLALALTLPQVASAGKVVLAPMLAEGSINDKQRVGLHQLLESELDFAPEVSGVVSLPAQPPNLDEACLSNPGCLGSIASANGGTDVITGKVVGAGANFDIDMVYFANNQIVRRKKFSVAQDPTTLANSMTPIIRELLTGESPTEAAAAAPTADDFSFDDDDGGFGAGAAVAVADDGVADLLAADSLEDLDRQAAAEQAAQAEAARIAAQQEAARVAAQQEAARIAAEQEAARIAAEQEAARIAAEQEAARIAEQQRIAAEQEAARRAEEERRLAAAAAAATPAPQPANDDDLAGMISFGGSVEDIKAEEVDQMIQFGAPAPAPAAQPAPVAPAPAPVARPTPQPQGGGNALDPLLAEEEAELAAMQGNAIQDLDGEEKGGRAKKEKTPRATNNTGSTATVERPLAQAIQITARGGYSRYYSFDFITAGGEVAVPIVAGLHGIAGVEAYAVNRVLPPELQIERGLYSEWNTIFPVNVGGIYKFTAGIAQPYVGADVIFVQYYKDLVGADWAGGARIRGGVDIMVVRNFGFNVNVAAGAWTGKNWGLIEQGVAPSGFLPQVSGGTVLQF